MIGAILFHSLDLINKYLVFDEIDLELLVYKYFGDIPALMLRKIMSNQPQQEEYPFQQYEVNRILRSFRDISIRLDRLEHVLIN